MYSRGTEARGCSRKSHNVEDQVFTSHTSRKRGRKKYFKRFEDKYPSSSSNFKRKKDFSKIKCFRCEKLGHFAKHCIVKLNLHNVTISDSKESSPSKDSYEYLEGLVLISVLSSHVQADCNTWLIDSGASCHIFGFKQNMQI